MNTKTKPLSTDLQSGQHRICYAYASSVGATRLGRGKNGCYVLETAISEVALDSYEEAAERAKSLGTEPNRWSMDHHDNARFLTNEVRGVRAQGG
jgi:hypothetical protein